jgi:hypothetical protein
MNLQKDTALKRLLYRTLWTLLAALITTVIAYITDNYGNMAWYPLVLYALTTLKDLANRNLPNLPEAK